MRGNVIAIIALVLFVLLAGGTGFLAYKNYMDVERQSGEGAQAGLREELRNTAAKRQDNEAKLAKKQAELVEKQAENRKKYEERLRELVRLHVLSTQSEAQQLTTSAAAAWKAEVEKTASDNTSGLVTPVETEVNDRITAARALNDKQRDEIVEKIKAITAEIAQVKKDAGEKMRALNADTVRLNNEISAASGDIERLISREPLSGGGLPPAGRVLASAADTKVAVINLGTRVGIKRGMRFEVYQVRYGNRRVHKGYLEVKAAEPEVSTCSILFKEVRLPRCPICNYTAEQPEELYCPRCTSPGSPQAFQGLKGNPKVVTVGQSDTDPIVKGDLIYNPLFSLRPGTRFAVVGEPLLAPVPRPPGDVQTPKLLEHIRNTVEFYGGKVVNEVTAETDVLVALRGAKDAVSRAEEMGIPVVREFEIFRYLEK